MRPTSYVVYNLSLIALFSMQHFSRDGILIEIFRPLKRFQEKIEAFCTKYRRYPGKIVNEKNEIKIYLLLKITHKIVAPFRDSP